ncbi:unnamed protein product, partial [Protopolystoma xenopodis]
EESLLDKRAAKGVDQGVNICWSRSSLGAEVCSSATSPVSGTKAALLPGLEPTSRSSSSCSTASAPLVQSTTAPSSGQNEANPVGLDSGACIGVTPAQGVLLSTSAGATRRRPMRLVRHETGFSRPLARPMPRLASAGLTGLPNHQQEQWVDGPNADYSQSPETGKQKVPSRPSEGPRSQSSHRHHNLQYHHHHHHPYHHNHSHNHSPNHHPHLQRCLHTHHHGYHQHHLSPQHRTNCQKESQPTGHSNQNSRIACRQPSEVR